METGNGITSNLISIIVPVYNGEDFINRCVQSIIAQSYPTWELLLIDGASTDATLAKCEEWQAKDSRIRVFRAEENKGVSEGRNTGIREAKGEYLMFVDADDWLMPDCLERLYADIQETDVDIAGCTFQRCSDVAQTDREKTKDMSYGKKLIAGTDFLPDGILRQDTRCWSKLYRKKIVEGHFFREDYVIGEDMLFLWETAKDAKLISSSEYPGYCYYHNVNGAMLKPFREKDIDQIRCWQLVLDTIQEENRHAEAQQKPPVYDNDVISRTATILLVSCMLVVGKLSQVPTHERVSYNTVQKQCIDTLRETLQIPGAYEGLDKGYRIKVALFRKFPNFYMQLYHGLKSIKRK